jgi:hypothetical protein
MRTGGRFVSIVFGSVGVLPSTKTKSFTGGLVLRRGSVTVLYFERLLELPGLCMRQKDLQSKDQATRLSAVPLPRGRFTKSRPSRFNGELKGGQVESSSSSSCGQVVCALIVVCILPTSLDHPVIPAFLTLSSTCLIQLRSLASTPKG